MIQYSKLLPTIFLTIVALSGCGDDSVTVATSDGGPLANQGSETDAGSLPDAEGLEDVRSDVATDAGTDDVGAVDSGMPDANRPLEDPERSSEFPLADPDSVLAEDGKYLTYGTTVPAGQGKRCGGVGELFVPFLEHGSGSSVRISDCAKGDALPGGPGAWAEPGGAIWAPGIARFGDRYFMYYTASRRGSGQKCIGRATASGARGPFVSQGEFACPPDGRWAIDANPFVTGGVLYVAYRDDAIAAGAETGISVVRTDSEGRADWATRKDVLKSTDITWDTTAISGTTHVIENPSMFQIDGEWYVAYSGNNWDSPRYATGIASCGTDPLPTSRCTPVGEGVAKPYFGFTGVEGLGPYRGLPANHQGPGGMDVFAAADGTLRAVWHWWNPLNAQRYIAIGRLLRGQDGFSVGP